MKPSEALAKARPLIETGKEVYICLALAEFESPGARKAIDHIMRLLDGHSSYDGWLMRRLGIDGDDDPDKLRASRLAWIDAMIAYWQAKGE